MAPHTQKQPCRRRHMTFNTHTHTRTHTNTNPHSLEIFTNPAEKCSTSFILRTTMYLKGQGCFSGPQIGSRQGLLGPSNSLGSLTFPDFLGFLGGLFSFSNGNRATSLMIHHKIHIAFCTYLPNALVKIHLGPRTGLGT